MSDVIGWISKIKHESKNNLADSRDFCAVSMHSHLKKKNFLGSVGGFQVTPASAPPPPLFLVYWVFISVLGIFFFLRS